MKRSSWVRVSLLALVAMVVAVPAASAKKKEKVDVCKHGCDYRTIQDAVDATGKNAVINVRPGKYKEGVRIVGKKHNGLTIQGTDKNPKKVILEGKNAKDPRASRPTTGSRPTASTASACSTSGPATTSPTGSSSTATASRARPATAT